MNTHRPDSSGFETSIAFSGTCSQDTTSISYRPAAGYDLSVGLRRRYRGSSSRIARKPKLVVSSRVLPSHVTMDFFTKVREEEYLCTFRGFHLARA